MQSYEHLTTLHCESCLAVLGKNDEVYIVRAGRLFIIPSTYVDGKKFMRQQMQDIVAISNTIGHSYFFITITCDPYWSEIRRPLLPGQIPKDVPNFAARLFIMKLQAMMLYIIEEDLFPNVASLVVL